MRGVHSATERETGGVEDAVAGHESRGRGRKRLGGGDALAQGAAPRQHREPLGSRVFAGQEAFRCPGEFSVSNNCVCFLLVKQSSLLPRLREVGLYPKHDLYAKKLGLSLRCFVVVSLCCRQIVAHVEGFLLVSGVESAITVQEEFRFLGSIKSRRIMIECKLSKD